MVYHLPFVMNGSSTVGRNLKSYRSAAMGGPLETFPPEVIILGFGTDVDGAPCTAPV